MNFPKQYVIGVDGGGAKTSAFLADLNGKISAKADTGSSSLRNLGLKEAIGNAVLAVEQVLKKAERNSKICAVFFGLPAVEEEFKFKKDLVRRELLKHKEISRIFKGKVKIGSDQLAGFRSGTNEKEGIVLVSGFGCVCHGWRNGKEIKVGGWGYLSETGSAFFVGQEALKAIFKDLDGRASKTLLTKLVFDNLKAKNKEKLVSLIYSKKLTEIVPLLSVCCSLAAEKNDKTAKGIMASAGRELALSVKVVAEKLGFDKKKFPLVLVGSMFNSKIVLNTVKKEIRKFAPGAEFIRPETEPAIGAVKLAVGMAVDEIAKELKKGKTAVCPTDTVYGLLANAADRKAVDKIFKIKKREKTNFLPIFISDLTAAKELAVIGKSQEKFLRKIWPGRTTVVLKRRKKKSGVKIYGVDEKTIALRIPKYELVNNLLEKTKLPLVGTSANISNRPAETKITNVLKQFRGNKPDFIVNVGDLRLARPSTVIDLTGAKPKILRK